MNRSSSGDEPATPASNEADPKSALPPPGDTESLMVVGLGASAGGLEALDQLLPTLPSSPRLAYIVLLHRKAGPDDLLAQILARATPMPVRLVRDGDEPTAGVVLVAPSGQDVSLAGWPPKLQVRPSVGGPTPSIDAFFASLAQTVGDLAIGVLLSGTGSDGVRGLLAIKTEGGTSIVQDPASAVFEALPSAAIHAGCVDLALTPAEIGAELGRLVDALHPPAPQELGASSERPFRQILRLLCDVTGCDFNEYKPTTLRRRVARRMAIERQDSLDEYRDLLVRDPGKVAELAGDVLISVTSFFRDPDAFDSVRGVIAAAIAGKAAGQRLRIWVPGCATGEEAYSLGILVSEVLDSVHRDLTVQIFATDLDSRAIDSARHGTFPQVALSHMPEDLKRRYFTTEGDKVVVRKWLRDLIVFAHHNVARHPPFLHLDLISCRNVLIYLLPELQRKIIATFHYALDPGGHLFLGKHESIGKQGGLFVLWDKRAKLFQRAEARTKPPVFQVSPVRGSTAPEARVRPGEHRDGLSESMNEAIAHRFEARGVILDDRLNVVFVRGDVSRYLSLRPGHPNLNVLALAAEHVRLELRTVVQRVRIERMPASLPVRLGPHYSGEQVVIYAAPLRSTGEQRDHIVVLFEPGRPEPEEQPPEATKEQDVTEHVKELERELAATREHLQTTIEELETANEELQSLNEEMQASNEELQSSNEELATTNEELQSANEELVTVNEELENATTNLRHVNSELEGVLRSVGVAVVVTDRELRIVRFTPEARRVFRLTQDDVGKVLSTVPCEINLSHLREDVLSVIDSREMVERKVGDGERTFWMRVRPYVGEGGAVQGATLTFFDERDVKAISSSLGARRRKPRKTE